MLNLVHSLHHSLHHPPFLATVFGEEFAKFSSPNWCQGQQQQQLENWLAQWEDYISKVRRRKKCGRGQMIGDKWWAGGWRAADDDVWRCWSKSTHSAIQTDTKPIRLSSPLFVSPLISSHNSPLSSFLPQSPSPSPSSSFFLHLPSQFPPTQSYPKSAAVAVLPLLIAVVSWLLHFWGSIGSWLQQQQHQQQPKALIQVLRLQYYSLPQLISNGQPPRQRRQGWPVNDLWMRGILQQQWVNNGIW
jgi:hypothetical protein